MDSEFPALDSLALIDTEYTFCVYQSIGIGAKTSTISHAKISDSLVASPLPRNLFPALDGICILYSVHKVAIKLDNISGTDETSYNRSH